MSGTIKGITIELDGDTKGLDSALKSVTSESVQLGKDLKAVNQLLKLDPGNAELVAQKQQILSESIEKTAEKLKVLRAAQEQVKQQFESGEISREQYIAFQSELVNTEKRLKDLESQENETSKSTINLGEAFKNGLVVGAKAAAAALAAATAAVAATVGGIVKATAATAEYGDNIDKMSQKLGMSAEAYQEWDFIMQHNGGNIDQMTTSMKKLSEAVVDQSKTSVAAFEKLGISMEDAANMSQEELFSETIKALQGMESGAERTALAADLLGKSAMELGPLLNMSAEETEAMRQQVHDLGGVMSDDAVKASARYKDSLQNMKTAISGAARTITSGFLPSLSGMMDGVAKLVSGDSSGIGLITSGIKDFTQNLADLVPMLTETAGELIPVIIDAITASLPLLLDTAADILTMLAQGLIKALPTIVSVAGQILLQLADALIGMLPEIITVGLQVVTQLALGIAEALPTLIPTIVDVILQIVDTLIDNIDMLIDAAIQLIIGLAQGLIQALPRLIEKAPVIIAKLVTAIIDNAPKLLSAALELIKTLATGIIKALPALVGAAGEIVSTIFNKLKEMPAKALQWGKDLVKGLIDGIKSMISGVGEAVKGVASKIKSFLHFSRPDEGPLREYEQWMPDMMQGLATGIKKNIKLVKNAVGDLADTMTPELELSPSIAQYRAGRLVMPAANGGAPSAASSGNTINITVNVQQMSSDYDARRAAEIMAQEIGRLTQDNNSMIGAWSV